MTASKKELSFLLARQLHTSCPGKSGKEKAVNVAIYITEEERQELEAAIKELGFRIETGEECFSLLQFIRKRTDELMYLIPRTLGALKEEFLVAFYLQVRKHCDKVIFSYVPDKGNRCYLNYLKAFINFHISGFKLRNRIQQNKEYALNYISITEKYTPNCTASVVREGYKDDRISDDTAKEVYELIIEPPQEECAEGESPYFTDRTSRLRLMLFILTHYDTLSAVMQRRLASLYAVDIELFETISTYLEEERARRITPRMEHREKMMSEYWLRFVILSNAITTESDDTRRKELEYQSDVVLKKLRTHQNSPHRSTPGMSYRRVADVVGYSLSKTGYNITKAKDIIAELQNIEGVYS